MNDGYDDMDGGYDDMELDTSHGGREEGEGEEGGEASMQGMGQLDLSPVHPTTPDQVGAAAAAAAAF
jgi:hypothetical protein